MRYCFLSAASYLSYKCNLQPRHKLQNFFNKQNSKSKCDRRRWSLVSLPSGEHKLSSGLSKKLFINCIRLWTFKYQLVLICHSSVLHFKHYLTFKTTLAGLPGDLPAGGQLGGRPGSGDPQKLSVAWEELQTICGNVNPLQVNTEYFLFLHSLSCRKTQNTCFSSESYCTYSNR